MTEERTVCGSVSKSTRPMGRSRNGYMVEVGIIDRENGRSASRDPQLLTETTLFLLEVTLGSNSNTNLE